MMAVLLQQILANYEDSWQPTGNVKFDGFPRVPHFEMKKLVHKLILIVEGPDDGAAIVHNCLQQAGVAALIAAVGAAFASGGAAAGAAWEAGKAVFLGCLGEKFVARLDDQS